jgi:anti-anti-sigma factor
VEPQPLLTVTHRTTNGNRAEFAAAGEIDASTHEQLRTAMLAAIDGGAKDLVVDLSDVTFLDSSGLRGLIESIRSGATVTLRHLRPAVQQVFDIVNIPGIKIEP